MPMHVDLPRLKEGMNGGAFWSAFVPCPSNGSDFSDKNYADGECFSSLSVGLLASNPFYLIFQKLKYINSR
jgi:membrane dipeptidase